jgi:NADH-quinone oxidoreductase subunit N
LAAIVYCVIYPTLSIVFYKITTNIFYHIKTRWIFLFMGLASIASFSAQLLFQNNLRKIITCVLMNYIGTIFLCCAFPCYNSVGGVIFLISSQVVSLLGIFFLLAMVKKSKFQEIDDIRDLCSLSRKHPFFALSTSILFLSFLGFPPFLGFFGKFYVCSTIIGQGLALVIYAISFISNLICMSKILDAIWFKKNNEFFIFDGSTERMIHAFACLTIVAVPLVYKILQLINTELYFA